MREHNIRVVTIGGGTGMFTVLSELKRYTDIDVTAVVNMADDGGSTGRLRDEYGVLPPGDLRQCLVALSDAPLILRRLFAYRYAHGDLRGHTFGNIFLSTIEQVSGSLDKALEVAAEILKIRGAVVPVTLDRTHLCAELKNGKKIVGEYALSNYQLVSRFGIKRIYLSPKAKANPKALLAIRHAEVIIIGPGNFYSSLVPNLLVSGIVPALARSKAKKILVANIMNKHGQTDGFSPGTYLSELERIAGTRLFEAVLYNTKRPPTKLLRQYIDEGEPIRKAGKIVDGRPCIGRDLLALGLYKPPQGDQIPRSLIRHDPAKLAAALRALFP